MKKGFTLIELLAVVVIIGIVTLISVPAVLKTIEQSKNKLYDTVISNIKVGMRNWLTDKHITLNSGDKIYLTVSQLKHENYLDELIKNPKTGDMFPNDTILIIENKNGALEYQIDNNGTATKKYNGPTPYLEIVGDFRKTLNIGDTYTNPSIYAYNGSGEEVDVTITRTVMENKTISTNRKANYYVLYTATIDGIPVSLVENVSVVNPNKICYAKTKADETLYTPGDTYECDPGDGVKRDFYVLEVRENEVLFLAYKILGDPVYWGTVGSNEPTISYTYLKDKTKDWSDVVVTMPTYEQFQSVGNSVNNNLVLPSWTLTGYSCYPARCTEGGTITDSYVDGYWLASAKDSTYAYCTYAAQALGSRPKQSAKMGVKPVITVPKEQIFN